MEKEKTLYIYIYIYGNKKWYIVLRFYFLKNKNKKFKEWIIKGARNDKITKISFFLKKKK